jgi:hypothetical protein
LATIFRITLVAMMSTGLQNIFCGARFNQVNRAKLTIYPQLANPTDPSNVRLVFAAIKETILQQALRDAGIPNKELE